MHVKIFHNTIQSFCTNIELFIFSSYQNLNTARIYEYEFPEHIFLEVPEHLSNDTNTPRAQVLILLMRNSCLSCETASRWLSG